MSKVSVGCPTGPIIEFLEEWGTENLDMIDIREIANPRTTKVFVNGNWVGVHRDPEELTGAYSYIYICIYIYKYIYK
jgi:DNA-directed RNA polymerase II subunit RPB2